MANKIGFAIAVTGGIHTLSMFIYLLQTLEQIIHDAVYVCEAEDMVVHIRARKPEDEKLSSGGNEIRAISTVIRKCYNVNLSAE